MKRFTFTLVASFCLISAFAASHSHAQGFAFARSEDELMEADIREAKRRATDFKSHIARAREYQRRMEQMGPQEVKQDRDAREKRQELAREQFIRERNARPITPDAVIARQERQEERDRERLEVELEKHRRVYLEKRRRVRETIRREGYIDERREFDI